MLCASCLHNVGVWAYHWSFTSQTAGLKNCSKSKIIVVFFVLLCLFGFFLLGFFGGFLFGWFGFVLKH